MHKQNKMACRHWKITLNCIIKVNRYNKPIKNQTNIKHVSWSKGKRQKEKD